MNFILSAVVLLVSAILWLLLGKSGPNLLIVGGRNATIEEFPHQVSIEQYGDLFCGGGSILSRKAILTAAHVFDEVDDAVGTTYAVRVGSSFHPRRGRGKVFKVDKFFVHPDFDSVSLNYDVAVVRLVDSIDFADQSVVSAPINLATEKPRVGESLTVIGFGQISYNDERMSEVLQAATIPLRNNSVCGLDDDDGQLILCAGDGAVGPFHGDSGGPLINSKHQIVGIVSWGRKESTANPAYFSVYVNTEHSSIYKFILSHTEPSPE